ncbi:outer membrane lipoprotein carrier protein LolA [Mesonia ostreae]|uniref:Outer membrane lipoprotein carrier protein LolA n=1 Tax=Mesonia ostreae TaxID=861110 RepID=A0ABU2KI43_9FLAO|nr:outer membrane lipoprotein carrier protein LolA [Mesonia ostreae]MDT0294376.1 outer membrane lipoprotein carrier protein LolA [Mesonia ostreae]
MPILKFTFFVLFFTCFLSWSQQPLSKKEELDFLKQVRETSELTKTLKGTFLQTKQLSFLEKRIESTGDFYYQTPNLVKWEYKEPYLYSVIFKNGSLLINDNGKKQDVDLASNKLFEKLSDLIANSMNGKMLTDTDFSTSFFKNNGEIMARLIPQQKQLAEFFKAIELHFNENSFLVGKVKLIEQSGDFTLIELQNLQQNPSLDASVFTH